MAQIDPSGRWPAGRSAGSLDAAWFARGGRGPAARPGRDAGRCRSRGHRPVDAGDPRTRPTWPTSTALGNRTYSTIHGSLSSTYVEYFEDDNATASRTRARRHRLVLLARRPRARAGVTVRSTRPPEDALHVSRERDPDRRAALSARGRTRNTATKRVAPASRSNRRSSSTRPTASPERGRRSTWTPRCRGPARPSS